MTVAYGIDDKDASDGRRQGLRERDLRHHTRVVASARKVVLDHVPKGPIPRVRLRYSDSGENRRLDGPPKVSRRRLALERQRGHF